MPSTAAPVAVDLFCGAGGASLGIREAGFDVVAAVDINESALQTHNENLPCDPILHDLKTVDTSILPRDTDDIQYVHGSPPCKGFSQARGERNPDDERNELVFSFINWVDAISPKVATLENVTGITNITDDFLEVVESEFNEIGYTMQWTVLNAVNYGVPQKRRRVFCVAVRDDLVPSTPDDWFPDQTHSFDDPNRQNPRSVRDAIGDLVFGGVKEDRPIPVFVDGLRSQPLCNHDKPPIPASRDEPVLLTDQINESHQLNGRRPIHSISKPTNTVRAGTTDTLLEWDGESDRDHDPQSVKRNFTDSEKYRRLSIRECARLQSFPDWFVFTGTKTEQKHQIGNAVPPLLQYHVANSIQTLVEF